MDERDGLALSDRLIGSMLAVFPPHQRGMAYAAWVVERRGEPEDEAGRTAHYLIAAFEGREADPMRGWQELCRNLGNRSPEVGAEVLRRLRERWGMPTPSQADVLRVGAMCVEVATARAAGLGEAAAMLMLYALDPARPPVGHPAFAAAITPVGVGMSASGLAREITAHLPSMPLANPAITVALPHVVAALVRRGPP